MPVEVYSTVKPASTRRAWVSSALLLVLAGALAASVTRHEAGPGIFGERIEPKGWEISFRPPSIFNEVDSAPGEFSSTYRYQLVADDGDAVELIFWRLPAENAATPLTICGTVLNTAESWLTILIGKARIRAPAQLADRPGLEVISTSIPMIVRSTVLGNGWAYAVSLRILQRPNADGPPARIQEPLYRLFDLTCRAMRFRSDGRGSAFRTANVGECCFRFNPSGERNRRDERSNRIGSRFASAPRSAMSCRSRSAL